MERRAHFGVIGLTGIGAALASQALGKGMHVVGYEAAGVGEELHALGIDLLEMPGQFHQRLDPPRKILLQVPAAAIERTLGQLTPVLEQGDVVLDASDSHWSDSARRQRKALEQGIHLVDCGIAGGLQGARTGACFMLGGEPEGVRLVEPLLSPLAAPGSLVHCGPPGSGHFVKAVHDAIQSALIQALGEGVQLLESWPDQLPIAAVIRAWAGGASIRSWPLAQLAETIDSTVAEAAPHSSADACKLLEQAAHQRLAVPVLAQAAMQTLASAKGGLAADRIADLILGAMNRGRAEGGEGELQERPITPWLIREAPKGPAETNGSRPN